MIKKKSSKFGKPLYILYPGEHFACKKDIVLSTVTGICVVICLSDSINGIGGMGHFVVPESKGTEGIFADEIAQKSITKIELLIGEIVKLGGDRKNCDATIFGAGYLDDNKYGFENLSETSIQFINDYFSLEKIKVRKMDLGGNSRRQINFFLEDGKIFRKLLKNNEESSEFIKLEKEYIDLEFRNRTTTGKVLLFK